MKKDEKKSKKKWLIGTAAVVAVLLIGGYCVAHHYLYSQLLAGDEKVYIYVDKDDNVDSVLHKVEAVANPTAMTGFRKAVSFKDYGSNIKRGRYELNKDASAWHLMDLHKLIETNFATVPENGTLRDIVEAIKCSKRNLFPVVDAHNKFLGLIVMDDIRQTIFETQLYDTLTVRELMMTFDDKDIVHSSDSLSDVVNKFQLSNRYNLIVVDDDGTYLGFLSRANTFSAYRRFISQSSEE